MTKEFIRRGRTVAIPEPDYPGYWFVLPLSDPVKAFEVFTGNDDRWTEEDTLNDVLKVLKAIKKEASK